VSVVGRQERYTGEVTVERPAKIVIVDDDGLFLRGLGRQLRAQAGALDVELVTSFDVGGAQGFDMVVLDYHLRGVTGVETCRALRATGNAATVVIASTEMSEEVASLAYEAGADYTLHKPFNPTTLVELVRRARAPASPPIVDRDALVDEHRELAHNIARRLARRYGAMLAAEDIEALGILGLCEAAARFDTSRGEPFVAFAAQRIHGAILDELRRASLQSRHGYERRRKIEDARRALVHAGADPTDEAVAAQLGVTVDVVLAASTAPTRVPESEIAAVAADDATPATHAERAEMLALIAAARDGLAPLEAEAIHLHYDRGFTVAQIARELGVSPARVTKLLARALAHLRDVLR
jgi:RNA polymerase sigma factor for flagellar operon FliA